MFGETCAFDQPLADWNVSRVKTMVGMFCGAAAFNHPIGAWDVGAVTDMDYMFWEATAFNQPIGGWDMRRVTNTHRMLCGADSFQQLVSGWSVCSSMSSPFEDRCNHYIRVAGMDLEWYPSQCGRRIDQSLRAHDMVVLLRRSFYQSFLWWKLPEELAHMVGQWLGLDISERIFHCTT
jgi:hypothetical protein